MHKTKNYNLFKYREDNREKIDRSHVERLSHSISSRNLLELRPIIVNEQMEVLDGQHRLEAAKLLGIDIYYRIEKELDSKDIILMNVAKAWALPDYMNYYLKNKAPEYLKLNEFMRKEGLNLKLALNLCVGNSRKDMDDFRQGRMVFNQGLAQEEIALVREIIDYIKKMNGYSNYTESGKFWKSTLKMVRHADFDVKRWWNNIPKMVHKFRAQATCEDYCKIFMDTFNYRGQKKMDLIDTNNYD